MTHHIALNIARFFCSKNVISKDSIDSYAYGFELILISAVNWGAVFILMLLTKTFAETLLYVSVFITLRHHAGGYHADSHLKCFFLSLGAYLVFLVLLFAIPTEFCFYISLGCIVFALPAIFILAPVEHKNHPVTVAEIKKHRTIVRLLSIPVSVIAVAFAALRFSALSVALASALFQVGISLIAGLYIQNKKGGATQ